MLEFHLIPGVSVTAQELKTVSDTPLSALRKLVEKVMRVVDGERAYVYGGALRNYVWKILGKKLPPHKVDTDVLITTSMAFDKIITAVSSISEFSPPLIVSTDTLRVALGKDIHADFKFTPMVKFAMLDFTINAVVAPFEEIFGRGAPLYCVSLEDLDNKILRHISPFNVYPFHLLRGIRLASAYKLKFAPQTLQEYRKKAKFVKNVSPPLIHRELASAVQEGYEYAVWAVAATNLILEIFPSLKNFARKKPEEYAKAVEEAHRIISAFNPDTGDEDVLKIAPPKLLEKQFAPGGRNLLYCYFLSSFLLPLNVNEKLLMEMHELNLYPAERGIIAMCITFAKGNAELKQVNPLARPFVLAVRKVKGS